MSGAESAAMTRHLEVERKFDVSDAIPTPAFETSSIIGKVERQPAQVLIAVYFDTPERDLTAHGITLRRRTGGSDAGWHLKRNAGKLARTEIRTPLGDGPHTEVPPNLLTMVRAFVRARPLAPIARITNHRDVQLLHRTDGILIAEFCDDHVSAKAPGRKGEQRWREWEIELSAELAAMDDAGLQTIEYLSSLAVQAGGTPSQHASKLSRTLGLSR